MIEQLTDRNSMKDLLDGVPGFVTGLRLQSDELARVRFLIESHWLSCIKKKAPEYADRFAKIGIDRYHELAHLIDHSTFWQSVAERNLPFSASAEIRTLSIFKQIEREFGSFTIPDAYGWGSGEPMVFRLVRPNETSDVGPLHRDQWFWDLLEKKVPSDVIPYKIWMAIFCEPGLSGLRIVSDSHLQEIPYHGEMRNGMLKPQMDVREDEFAIELFQSQPGDAIIFNHDLLHGGAVTTGNYTRVSLELTIFVPKK